MISQKEYDDTEQQVRAVLDKHTASVIGRDSILIGVAGPVPRRIGKMEKDVHSANLRRRITNVMNRIVLEGKWEPYGSPRNPRWRRVS